MKQPSENSRLSAPCNGQSTADPWVARLTADAIEGLSEPELEAAYQRARQMLAANLCAAAQAVLQALLLLQPNSARLARTLGITYLRRQQVRQARAMFAYGLQLDGHDSIMQLLHGECVLLCGERDLGLRLLEQALAAAASHPATHAYIIRAQKCMVMARQAAP